MCLCSIAYKENIEAITQLYGDIKMEKYKIVLKKVKSLCPLWNIKLKIAFKHHVLFF